MNKTILMIAWVIAASAFTSFAQDTNSATTHAPAATANASTNNAHTPAPVRTGPVKDAKYYDALKKWNAHEIKNIGEIEWIAHTVFTPAEDKQYRAIGPIVAKFPEVQAARKAQRDATFAAMCKADPTVAPVTEKLETAYMTTPSGREATAEREAMTSLTPEEKAHYDRVLPAASRSPEAKAAGQAYKDAVRAAAIKADPINGQLIDRLDSSYKVVRADFRYQPENKNPEGKPVASQ